MNKITRIRTFSWHFTLFICLTLSGCGGGGSGGGSEGATVSEVVYDGKTSAATLTIANANKIFSEIWSGGASPPVLGKGTENGDVKASRGLKKRAQHWMRLILKNVSGSANQAKVLSSKPVNETVRGNISGTLRRSGDLNEDGTGTLTLIFTNFNDGDGETLDGQMTAIVRVYDPVRDLILDMEIQVQRLTVKDAESNFSMSGNIRLLISLETKSETMILNLALRNNVNRETTKLEEFKLLTTYDNFLSPTSFSEEGSGRIYIASEGYVDFSTPSPFQYGSFPQENPDRGGPLLMEGLGLSKAHVVAQSISRVRIEVDLDGNGVLEDVSVYLWDDLRGSSVPNHPPQLLGLKLSPENAVTTDNLTAGFDAVSDPDGDNLIVTYSWKIDGNSIPDEDKAILASTRFSKGDEVTTSVIVSDGIVSETYRISAVIQNTSPILGVLSVSPSSAFTTDDLSARLPSVSDVDGDPLTFVYTWRRDGSIVPNESGQTLASHHFVKGQTIFVRVSVSDGTDTVKVASTPLVILDSPPVINASGIPDSILYGQEAIFPIHATDADNDPVTYKKTYGPQSLTVNASSGEITWVPTGPMFDNQLNVHFGVDVTAAGLSVQSSRTLSVSDPDRQQPLVRGRVAIPSGKHDLVVADFNGDGIREILLTDHAYLLQTLVFDGSEYVQDWAKPFILSSEETIHAVAAHDLSGDGNPDMIIAMGSRIVFLDGVTRKIFGEITGLFAPSGITVADIDNDGSPEIVFLDSSDFSSRTQRSIYVYSTSGLNLEWKSEPFDFFIEFVLGNIDTDPALEIISTKGQVWDGKTHLLEWSYGAGFGSDIDTGDMDNDGVDEIFGLGKQIIRVFSLGTKSLIKEIPFSGIKSDRATVLFASNIDSDPQVEVMIGYGGNFWIEGSGWSQQATVAAIDSLTGDQEWTQNTKNYRITDISLGDVDNDGSLELIWGTHDNFLEPIGNLVVAGFSPSINIEWILETQDQMNGPFIGARWLATKPEFHQSVFASPTRLVAIDPISNQMTFRLDMSAGIQASMDGADYDADGVDEIFLARNISTRTDLTLYDFDSDIAEWTTDFAREGGFPFGRPVVTHGDLNNDGHDDFITLSSDRIIYAYDVWNDVLLWKSEQLPRFLNDRAHDVEVEDLDGDGRLEMIAFVDNLIIVFGRNLDGSYSELRSRKVLGGSNLLIRDIDDDKLPEIIAIADYLDESGFRRSGGIFLYDGIDFSLKKVYPANLVIDDIIATPNLSGKKNLIIAIVDQGMSFVIEVDPFVGQEIWRSPGLMGKVQRNGMSFADTNNDGRFEMLFGTSDAMYITR